MVVTVPAGRAIAYFKMGIGRYGDEVLAKAVSSESSLKMNVTVHTPAK